MKLFNTLSRKKELFEPKGNINLFVCGPTVYDYSHIGHARTYIFFDAFVKFLRRRLNWQVNYLQNITDIEDKIIARAQEKNISPQAWAGAMEKSYYEDMTAIGVDAVSTYAPATQYIPEIILQVERLIKKGFAYEATGPSTTFGTSSVYFSVRKFDEYGRLSGQKISELKEGVRNEVEPGKKYFADFAVWKAAKTGEPAWPSPWGEGRPGWHIEDTAITEKHFGPRYHLHGGGMDLIFPHHEAEIAQMETVSGLKPLAQIWIHTGMLQVQGEKMAKSVGNFITIRDFLKKHSKETLRYLVLASHYRAPLDFSPKLVEMAEASIQRIKDCVSRLQTVTQTASSFPVADFINDFWKELADDFNTPQALAVLFELIKETNKLMDTHSLLHTDAKKIIDFINEVNDIWGILPKEEKIPAEIMALVQAREQIRQTGDFSKADELRQKIKNLGWQVEDTSSGPRITKS